MLYNKKYNKKLGEFGEPVDERRTTQVINPLSVGDNSPQLFLLNVMLLDL